MFKVGLQYHVVVLLKTFLYHKLNFVLKISPKTCTFKNIKENALLNLVTLYKS